MILDPLILEEVVNNLSGQVRSYEGFQSPNGAAVQPDRFRQCGGKNSLDTFWELRV